MGRPAFLWPGAAMTTSSWHTTLWIAATYAAVSLLTLTIYAIDKSAARAGGRRMPEATLHLLALAGGWPGALLAQQWLRHKSAKRKFPFYVLGYRNAQRVGIGDVVRAVGLAYKSCLRHIGL